MAKKLFSPADKAGKGTMFPNKETAEKLKERNEGNKKETPSKAPAKKDLGWIKTTSENASQNRESNQGSNTSPKLKLPGKSNGGNTPKQNPPNKEKAKSEKKKIKKTEANGSGKIKREKIVSIKGLKSTNTDRLGNVIMAHPAPTFKFKIAKKPVLKTGTINLKGGGKIQVEYGRNMVKNDKRSYSGKTENSGNWTCSVGQNNVDVVSPDSIILNPQFTKIFVGGIYDFENIANGSLKTVPYARKPLKIVTDNLKAKKANVIIDSPSSGEVQAGILKLIGGAGPGGSRTYGATFEMKSEEEFFMRTGGSGHYLGFGGSHNFNYKTNQKSHKYVVEVFQAYYTIYVDSDFNEPNDFFYLKSESNKSDAIEESKIDPNWVFVNSITYGRILYVVYESDFDFSEYGIDVNMYANFIVAGAELNLNAKQKKMLESTSVTIGALGGNPVSAGLLSNASSFKNLQKRVDDYFKNTNDEAPIAFSMATLDQGIVGTRMMTKYTSRQCSPRASKYRVTWLNVGNTVNDDAGNASEIKAYVRIKAIAGNGKSILDVDKKNKALANWESLPDAARKIAPAPWTFTVGSSANPLELTQGEVWNVNKYLDFNIPMDDPNAKIAMRVDVVEFDDFDDDHFEDNTWQGKISELSDKTPISLVSRHEGSRVTFMLEVKAMY